MLFPLQETFSLPSIYFVSWRAVLTPGTEDKDGSDDAAPSPGNLRRSITLEASTHF